MRVKKFCYFKSKKTHIPPNKMRYVLKRHEKCQKSARSPQRRSMQDPCRDVFEADGRWCTKV